MWKPEQLGDPIAARRVQFRAAGRTRLVSIEIGKPIKGPERRDPWWCPVRAGAPFKKFVAVPGQDSLQSLVLALEFLQRALPLWAREQRGRVAWLDEQERIVFADSALRSLQLTALTNALDGLRRALTALEQSSRPPQKLLRELRTLIARSGA